MIKYDTFVVKNCTSETMPEEIAGGKVVAWAEGQMLHRLSDFEEFVEKIRLSKFEHPHLAAGDFLAEKKHEDGYDG